MSRYQSRAGHTLIEILLALGLSLVILSAAYAALDQHWRYAEAGQRQTERMQVTRALFEKMSLDLRSVVFRPDVDLPRTDALDNTTRIEVVQRAELYVGRSLGIIGDGQNLVLQVDTPSVDQPVGVQTIRWQMHDIRSDRRTEDYVDENRASTEAVSRQRAFGLARLIHLETSSDTSKMDSPAEILADEVTTVRFRYFARGSWHDHWDSVEREELPQAVEIMIGFGDVSASDLTSSDRTNAGEYRLIVSIPASEV